MTLAVDEVVGLHQEGLNYVFHVPTSSFYEVDETTSRVLGWIRERGGLDPQDADSTWAEQLGVPLEEADALIGDLVQLGLLVPQGSERKPMARGDLPPTGESIRNLVLHVAHNCNLNCGYCYAEQGLYKGKATLMDRQQAIDFVDWFFDQADPEADTLGMTFFGGEPLMNFPVVEAAAERALERAKTSGQNIRFSITTNGTLVTKKTVDFLRRIQAAVTVSLDATGKTNDRLRPFHSGKGSYDVIMDRIAPLLAERAAVARVTVTRTNLDVVSTVNELLKKGFREVGCAPVDSDNPAYRLDGASYDRLLEGFQTLADTYIEEARQNRVFGFSNLSNLLKAIHKGENKDYPCGAGLQLLAASPTGQLSLCHRFVGEKDYELGSLKEGIDQNKRLAILDEVHLDHRSDCGSCWARYLCSGGCHHVNFLFTGEPSTTYTTHCDWLRAWYTIGLSTYAAILRDNPQFIERLLGNGPTCRN